MSSPSITVSVNLKIKEQEITLTMEEVNDLYSQLRAILGYNNQPYTVPYPWGNPSPYCTYTINCSEGPNSNWKTP